MLVELSVMEQRYQAVLAVVQDGWKVIEVARRRRPIDQRADRLLRIVADSAAVALEHVRLESEARELADVVRRIGKVE